MSAQALYSSSIQQVKNGKRCVEEQFVIIGDKGIKIKYYSLKNGKKEKISITGKDGEYSLKKITDDATVESTINNKELAVELKSSKLKFAKEYLQDTLKGGAIKSTKSKSKKSKISKK